MLYAEVVDRGVVELPLPADNVHIRELLLDLLIIIPGRLFCAVVLHDDKLQVLIRSLPSASGGYSCRGRTVWSLFGMITETSGSP